MNTQGKSSINESKTTMFPSMLMRSAGLSALVAGVCFIIVGWLHPLNIPSSITTATWANVHLVAMAMSIFGLFGMAGLYARQVEKSGWLGLVGFVLFSVWLGYALFSEGQAQSSEAIAKYPVHMVDRMYYYLQINSS